VTSKTVAQLETTGEEKVEPLRVLVVDDNASVLRFLLSAFTANHCQVTTAATAEQALAEASVLRLVLPARLESARPRLGSVQQRRIQPTRRRNHIQLLGPQPSGADQQQRRV